MAAAGAKRKRSREDGFTLVEILVSLLVLGILAGAAITFLISQNRAYAEGMSRSETVQNLRYAVLQLETNLATVGTHVPAGQPVVVYAGADLVAFHADYATNLTDDPFAVYYTPGAPTGQVSTPSSPLTLPGTSIAYPTTVYQAPGGIQSPAELVMLYFVADDLSEREDEFALVRQVNDGAPQVVARNLRRVGDQPFFRYMQVRVEPGEGLLLDSIPATSLPVAHPDAGGATTLADSIRGVRVQVASAAPVRGETDTPEVALSRLIRFPNAARTGAEIPLCGDAPLLGTPLTATLVGPPDAPEIQLSWNAAVDEVGGEQDVLRYLIWRRSTGVTEWGDPFRSIPSGSASYVWTDGNVEEDESYQYALAAQDCTPSLSALVTSGTVFVPASP